MKHTTIKNLFRAFTLASIMVGATAIAKKESKESNVSAILYNKTNQTIIMSSPNGSMIGVAANSPVGIGLKMNSLDKEIVFSYGNQSIVYPIPKKYRTKNWDFTASEYGAYVNGEAEKTSGITICGQWSDAVETTAAATVTTNAHEDQCISGAQ